MDEAAVKRTPLRRLSQFVRRTRMRRRLPRRVTRPSPDRDPSYLARVRELPCCAAHLSWCSGQIHAHHPRHLAGGFGLKAPDHTAIALCLTHHDALHGVRGAFKGWTRDQLRAWQDTWIERTQERLGRSPTTKIEEHTP